MLPYFGDLPLEMVTEMKVQEFIAQLKRTTFELKNKKGEVLKTYKLSRKTIKNIVGVVKLIVGKKAWLTWDIDLGKPEMPNQRWYTESQMEARQTSADIEGWGRGASRY